MLLFVTGASGSGKTVVIPGLRKKFPEFSVHDFDERYTPDPGDNRGRQEQTEYWISIAIENQRLGKDTIVCGGAVYGEILACPSIHQIDHLAVCLLDCSDLVRIERLRRHGGAPDMALLSWAAWLRVHAVETGALVRKYGKVAVVALSARRVGVSDVAGVLEKEPTLSDRFYELVLEAERKALGRRFR